MSSTGFRWCHLLDTYFCSMSPQKEKKIIRYSQEEMQNALEAVENGGSYKSVSKQFGIPRTTLMYKHQGKLPKNCRMGPKTVLTMEEENLLVQWLFHISSRGFPATKDNLLDSVQLLCKNLNRQTNFTNGKPGKKWYSLFLQRHREVTTRISQNLTLARASVSEENLRRWFGEITDYINEHNYGNIFKDPKRVFNADETAFF